MVINPSSGKIVSARAFDTYKSSAIDKFISKDIPEGNIVVAACKDECSTKMSKTLKLWF